ncbi:MAG: DUF4386 domain-containing protein [Ardenticatenaceae bacterium]|nr:DUF4386 domain-containing protein [Anaerolineales bacterium]MCB8923788.1 DUF4386 domain-containing protein [Ardenticatenaceae bacterium]MCB8990123.1 DUF4386 domain-containing protein [Ardenticatenaceae bacterium]
MIKSKAVTFGGWALIVGALSFTAVFTYLAITFNYPDVLDGPANEVLPALRGGGDAMRAIWAVYAFLPLAFVPAGIGTYHALKAADEGTMRLGMHMATISALASMLGLMRWPSIHWALAAFYEQADAAQQAVVTAVFNGLNVYLGNYIGEFLGELTFGLWLLLTAVTMFKSRHFPRWMAYMGLLTSVLGLIQMFRNVTDIVLPVNEVFNYLLPLWLLVLGIGVLRFARNHEGFSLQNEN